MLLIKNLNPFGEPQNNALKILNREKKCGSGWLDSVGGL